MSWLKAVLLGAALVLSGLAMRPEAYAALPEERLEDPELEERAREVSKGLRCLVCQNQSIDDSNATLARELRIIVRERIAAGDSNEEVLDYVVARYGDYVLMRPPVNAKTVILWISPLLLVALGGYGVFTFLRTQKKLAAAPDHAARPLTPEEERALARALEDAGDAESAGLTPSSPPPHPTTTSGRA